jgi:hypothetical protein
MNYLSLFVFYELSVIKNIFSDIYTEIIILYIVQKKFYKIAGLEKGEYDNFIFLILFFSFIMFMIFMKLCRNVLIFISQIVLFSGVTSLPLTTTSRPCLPVNKYTGISHVRFI